MKEYLPLVNEGMGGFLNPPQHPEHTFSFSSKDSSCSLSHVIERPELYKASMVSKAKSLFKKWADTKPALTSPEVKDWIAQVLGYFKNCYQSPLGSWNAGEVEVDRNANPMKNVDRHCGVHLIRQYYPEYMPTQADFDNAYWGKKTN